MQQKKNKNQNPILCCETSLIENKAPVSDKLQQCRKSSHRKVPCQDPWDSQWKRPQSLMEVVSWNLIYKNALISYSQLNP